MGNDSSGLDVLAAYERYMRSWSASENTMQSRRFILRRLLLDLDRDPDDVTSEQLSDWLGNPGWSAWTRHSYYHHVRGFFGWLHDTERITANPATKLRPPQPPRDTPRPLTAPERDLVLSSARGNLRTWLLLGLLAGLRSMEVAKLRGEDVSAESIYVLGKGRREALIPTHPELWAVAQGYPRSGWWFPSLYVEGSHVKAASVSGRVSRHFDRLGVEGSLHRCRHTYATQLLRNGANIRVVQTLMRHESLATTAKYTAVDETERLAAVRGLVAL